MADLIDRAALYDKLLYDTTKTMIGGSEYISDWRIADAIEEAPAVDAVEVKVLRRQLLKMGTLMYGGDEGEA